MPPFGKSLVKISFKSGRGFYFYYLFKKGVSSLNGNWLKFMDRLGANAVRIFVEPVPTLNNFLSKNNNLKGHDLNSNIIKNNESFQEAMTLLRSSNGRNFTYPWSNPFPWKYLYAEIEKITPYSGNILNTITMLKSIGIKNILLTQHIGSSSSPVHFTFSTLDPKNGTYWAEAWDLYQFSYAEALWAWSHNISLIEFYNEPDLQLGLTMDYRQYMQYYFIRCLSIQHLYQDMNVANPNSQVNVNLVASAFARATYGGDSSQ